MIKNIVIVGAGECGLRAALALRDQGFDGSVILVGAERHLPYERPPLSKDVLVGEDEPTAKAIASAAQLTERAIDFLPSAEAARIDREGHSVTLADGRSLPYDRLLLATGASPRVMPLATASRHCVYLRTFDDATDMRACLRQRKRVAVIGGGFIGLEIAASARKLGCTVTVLEAQGRLLARGVPHEIADILLNEHIAQGVRVVLGASIASIADEDDFARIMFTSGEILDAELVVIGIGAAPNVALAQSAGLDLENGIFTDAFLRTSDPTIFAAGDCCSFPNPLYGDRRLRLESWRNTHEQAVLAARNMLGASEPVSAVPWFWSDQYGLGLQVAGLMDAGSRAVRRANPDGSLLIFNLDESGRLVAASGIGPGNAVARDVRLGEMLIAQRATPQPSDLADPSIKLKTLLAAQPAPEREHQS